MFAVAVEQLISTNSLEFILALPAVVWILCAQLKKTAPQKPLQLQIWKQDLLYGWNICVNVSGCDIITRSLLISVTVTYVLLCCIPHFSSTEALSDSGHMVFLSFISITSCY